MDTTASGPPVWTAHEQPERQPGWGMWLCDCDACQLVLRAEAAVRPSTAFVVKSDGDRVVATAELLVDAYDRTGSLRALLYLNGDRIREVFVARGPLPEGTRWWSQTEQAYYERRNETFPPRTKAMRETPRRERERELEGYMVVRR